MNAEPDQRHDENLNPRLSRLLLVLLVLVGLYFCFAGRGGVHLFGDEFHSVLTLQKPYGELMKQYDRNGSGVALPLIQRFACNLFGPGLWAYRFPAIVGAMGTLLLAFAAARRLVGPVPAFIACFALAFNGLHIFYARFGRSYALTVCFAVLLVYALQRVLRRSNADAGSNTGRRSGAEKTTGERSDAPATPAGNSPGTDAYTAPKQWYLLIALSAGLLPFLHLTSITFVATVGAAAFITLLIDARIRRQWPWLAGSLALGAGLCFLLYQPAWEPLWDFINRKIDDTLNTPVGLWDLTSLMAGSHAAALVWMILLPVAAVWFAIRMRGNAFIMLTAAFAPALVLAAVQPYGKVYAYVRYLLFSMPFLLMLMAWLLTCVVRRVAGRSNRSNLVALAVGGALAIASFLAGPLGMRHVDDGPFANTYLSLTPLPAFDEPWKQTPIFYKTLSDSTEPLKIIEAPELLGKSMLLYRNYYLQHRKDVEIGAMSMHPRTMPAGPYLNLFDLQAVKSSDADYLIVHKKIDSEVNYYWRFVFDDIWPTRDAAHEAAFMEVHAGIHPDLERLMHQLSQIASRWIARARSELGEPFYTDGVIAVWKLQE